MEYYDDYYDGTVDAGVVLFALDWYCGELAQYAEGDAYSLDRSARHLSDCLSDESCPIDARDYALNVVACFVQCLASGGVDGALERERLAEEKRRRKYVALWKAFVVLLLVVTTGVLWRSSATALGAVVPIILVVYVLLGDAFPLKLAASFLKKRDDD